MVSSELGLADPSLEEGWVVVGKVLSPVGVRGEVKVEIHSDVPDRYTSGSVVFVDGSPLRIHHSRSTAQLMVVKFHGVDTRAAAETLRGKTLCVTQGDAPPLPQDTYYYYEVLGMRVFTEAGEDLGTVVQILATGANDVYIVRGDKGETMVPALAGIVVSLDVKGHRLTVRLPETL